MGFFAFWLRVKLWSLRPVTVTFKKNLTFFYWLRAIMGNFVQTTAVDYGPLRVITDYRGLWVVFLIFQHRSVIFNLGGQTIPFFGCRLNSNTR
jgi:hypothetical protein